MPEGDTVYLSAKRLHEALAGHALTASDFRLPQLATDDISGRTVVDVTPRGKHILIRLDDGRSLHSHFRMDGSWRVYSAGKRWRGPAHEIRVVLATATRHAVGYRLHDVALIRTAEEASLVGHLGPDLLGPDWDLDEAVRRLLARPDREIGPALLDQRNLAGIGNLYKSEVLFLRGISPWTRVADVRHPAALVTLARRLLTANKDRWEQVTTGERRPGRDHYVFERTGRPCWRCGTAIASAEQADNDYVRLSYWCPSCQPERSESPERSKTAG
ncbi:MAG: DNA-formamidopyrimidine glycosylase family protein [Mycobacteriales bacterium]